MTNLENKNELETSDTTTSILTKLKKKECNDTIWTRNCPTCKKILFYSCDYRRKTAEKLKSTCRSCSGKRLSRNNVGRIHSEHTKKLLSEQRLGNKNPMFGVKRPSYIGQIISQRNIKLWTGRKHTTETLQKMRESALKRVIQDRGSISYNNKACQIFDEINKTLNWNGRHALNGNEHQVLGYSVDYYEPTLNIVIEYDEKFHDNQSEKDVIRQKKITDHLNCKFYRIKYTDNWRDIIKL
jgi:hypothetical protein